MATIGTLAVNITAKTGNFQAGIAKSQKLLAGFGMAVAKASALIASLGVGAAVVGTVSLGAMVKGQMEAIDSLAKMSDKLGIGIEQLSTFQLASEESGVSVETLVKSLQTLEKNTSLGAIGKGPMDAFNRLKLDPDKLLGMNPEQKFTAVAGAISGLKNQSDRIAISMQLFGKSGADMLAVMRGGPAVLEEARQAAERLGLIISRDMAAGVERANDAFGRFKMTTMGLARQLAVRLAPIIEHASKWMEELLTNDGRIHKWADSIARGIGSVFAGILDGIHQVRVALLETTAKLKEEMAIFGQSGMAKWMGLSMSDQEVNGLNMSALNDRRAATDMGRQDPGGLFRSTFNRWLDDAMRAPEVVNKGGELFSKLLTGAKGLGRGVGNSAFALGTGVAKGSNPLNNLAWGKALNELSMGFAGSKFGSGKQRGMAEASPSLSFARTGSVESYRQRMAIGKQSETTKLQKKQLDEAKRTRIAVETIAKVPKLQPANF